MSNLSKINETDLSASEISLVDVIEFLQESWKTIAGFTVLGIAGAALYLWVIPNQYEASAQIKMAQISNFDNMSLLGVNIEEPGALIARMALPTSYPKEAIELCGLADQKDGAAALAIKAKFSIPKGAGGVVDLKIRDASKEVARACIISIFQAITLSQAQLIAPYIDNARAKLRIQEERLNHFSQVFAKIDHSGPAARAANLVAREEIRHLLDQISKLQYIIDITSHAAQLTAPIFVKDQPVLPQQLNSILLGVFLGGSLGVMLALARRWHRFNREALKR